MTSRPSHNARLTVASRSGERLQGFNDLSCVSRASRAQKYWPLRSCSSTTLSARMIFPQVRERRPVLQGPELHPSLCHSRSMDRLISASVSWGFEQSFRIVRTKDSALKHHRSSVNLHLDLRIIQNFLWNFCQQFGADFFRRITEIRIFQIFFQREWCADFQHVLQNVIASLMGRNLDGGV